MRKLFPFFAPLVAVLMVAGCNTDDVMNALESGSDRAVSVIAKGVDVECRRSIEARKEFLRRVNAKTATGDLVAADCDGDGAPDF